MKPALTAEEWAAGRFRDDDGKEISVGDDSVVSIVDETWRDPGSRSYAWIARRHALAALALHDLVVDGKPAGFTREDVLDCRDAGDAATCGKAYPDDLYGRMNNLADRIAALLPPESK